MARLRHEAHARMLVGHPAYNTESLCADLHRFVFLLGSSDG
jgi:hypothetical protein